MCVRTEGAPGAAAAHLLVQARLQARLALAVPAQAVLLLGGARALRVLLAAPPFLLLLLQRQHLPRPA